GGLRPSEGGPKAHACTVKILVPQDELALPGSAGYPNRVDEQHQVGGPLQAVVGEWHRVSPPDDLPFAQAKANHRRTVLVAIEALLVGERRLPPDVALHLDFRRVPGERPGNFGGESLRFQERLTGGDDAACGQNTGPRPSRDTHY